jgi:hypothetical protein
LEIEPGTEVRAMSEQRNGDQGTASEDHAEVDGTSSRSYGRRALMLGAATAGVGAAASLVAGAEPASATDGSALIVGESNTAKATTSISTKKGYGFVGETSASGGIGVGGSDTSTDGGFGLYGSSANGTGVYGTITGDTSGQYAVEGLDASTGAEGGAGIGGSSTNGTGVMGTSANGTGVTGIHNTGTGSGVSGEDNSGDVTSHGVFGVSTMGYGVFGTTDNGVGVYGNSSVGEGGVGVIGYGIWGVSGNSPGENGLGVTGFVSGEGGWAVCGTSQGTGDSYGVYASSDNSDALYVDGTAQVTGTLSKGGGSFKIDHPVDPENKYLYHSFVESSDMMNVYNGTVVLDGNGRATVKLPEWFEALNRDYRYQLTALLGAAPDLHVSALVADGKFSIAGGKAALQVSWQVTGIRQDAWANANRIPVEVDKKAEDRGRYLHPELFGGEAITALAKARDRVHRHRSNTPTV